MRKVNFLRNVNLTQRTESSLLVVKIQTEGVAEPEIIVNPEPNIDEKIKYYLEAYDDDMQLISAKIAGKKVEIIDAKIVRDWTYVF